MLTRRLSCLVVVVAALVVPAPASADTVRIESGVIQVTTSAGQADRITVLQNDATAPSHVVVDTGGSPSVGAPCTRYSDSARDGARCPISGIHRVDVGVGDRDDTVAGFETFRRFFLCGGPFFPPCPPTLHPLSIPLHVDGGPGRDTLRDGRAADDLRGGEGDDTLLSSSGGDALAGGPGDDVLTGGSGSDRLDGGSGDDTLAGGTAGDDDVHGGDGFDTVSYRSVAQAVRVTVDDVADDGRDDVDERDNIHGDVEAVAGGSGPDILTGNAGDNVLSGGAGKDQLSGGGGFDAFYGEEDGATILARDGNPERVDCGDGDGDFALTDDFDATSGCEGVDHSADLQGDLDGDGFAAPADCNDRDPGIHPGVTDAPDNGVDEDCSGTDATVTDRDGDGFRPPLDCDDGNAAIRPGAVEVFGDAVDEDCSGRADPLQTLDSFLQSSFRSGPRATTMLRLRVRNLAAGTLVRAICRGGRKRGCRAGRKEVRLARAAGTLDVRRLLKLKAVRPRARVEVHVLREDSIGEITLWTFRSRRLPRITERCVRPGGARVRCP